MESRSDQFYIGAGIAGLTLAQALRRHGVHFTIFERDESPEVRNQGWGVSIHSTLITWEAHILPEIYDRVCEAQVNPAVGRDEVRGVPWINGATGKVEQSVPESKRLRLRRDGIRKALMEGLDIKVSQDCPCVYQCLNETDSHCSGANNSSTLRKSRMVSEPSSWMVLLC